MTKRKWKEDSYAEGRMKALGVEYKIEEVPLAKIDWEGSKLNRARAAKALNDEVVVDYGASMEAGDTFPMVILTRGKKGFLIASGHHRLEAFKFFDEPSVQCYVIERDDDIIRDILPRTLNRGHGIQQDRKEALESAIYLVKHHGYNMTDAARLFSLSPKNVQMFTQLKDCRASLASHNINEKRLDDSTVRALLPIKTEKVRDEAAQVIISTGMRYIDASAFLMEVKGCKISEAEQLKLIYETASRLGSSAKLVSGEAAPALIKQEPTVANRKRSRFLGVLTVTENLLKGVTSLTQLQIVDKHEREHTKQRLEGLAKRFTSLSR